MERHYYNAESLSRRLREFEAEFGLSWHEFYERHVADDPALPVPRFERHVWARFYEDVRRLGGEAVMDRVSRTFATA